MNIKWKFQIFYVNNFYINSSTSSHLATKQARYVVDNNTERRNFQFKIAWNFHHPSLSTLKKTRKRDFITARRRRLILSSSKIIYWKFLKWLKSLWKMHKTAKTCQLITQNKRKKKSFIFNVKKSKMKIEENLFVYHFSIFYSTQKLISTCFPHKQIAQHFKFRVFLLFTLSPSLSFIMMTYRIPNVVSPVSASDDCSRQKLIVFHIFNDLQSRNTQQIFLFFLFFSSSSSVDINSPRWEIDMSLSTLTEQ
jgi:hypothetical protein